MKNIEVAALLNEIADYLEFQNEPFKVRAYRKAALMINGLSEDIEQVWNNNKLKELPGIGEGIAKKIDDFLKNGRSKHLDELKKKTPVDMEQLGAIEGIGPKTILKLYSKLKIKNTKDLEKAAKEGSIQNIEGLGPTVEKNILQSIAFAKNSSKRVPLGFALSDAEEIIGMLKTLKEVKRVNIAGSARRMKETIGDIDILVTSSNPQKVIDFFTKMPNVAQVLAKGSTKSSVRLKERIQADLRVVDDKIFGAALLYFTGSQQHNIILRKLAIERGLKLSEYGLFNRKNDKLIAGKTEEEVYQKLELDYIEPEMREDKGEIELAHRRMLPKIIGYNDLKGDLQMHTKWSDGSNTVEEIALAAKKLGHEYICITDHSGRLAIANSLDEKRILQQKKEIEKINKNINGLTILHGTEVNIAEDGSLDMNNKILQRLDIVVAAVHSGFKNSKEKITNRIIKAMQNKNVDIIAHPTGRLITKREAYEIDLDKVFDEAKKTGTVMEINSYPERMDLKDSNVRAGIKKGIKLVISTDAHATSQLHFIKLGIGTARRGWATKNDVINTRSLKGMLKMLKK
ncbi:MAG TPA: DNA polymerase/3'-5' exonuclease PolX [Candidatus Nanoarchaeia archaeon]|nr:DNA polymerase/3'-5' exonuclease PolX [Candidatus Nanoarchaeia archaeon]